MRNVLRLALVPGLLASVFPLKSEETRSCAIDAKKLVPRFSYCVAHVLKDTEGGMLVKGEKILDGKVLASATEAKSRLSGEQVEQVLRAASKDVRHIAKECYTPHHAFVFHAEGGEPVGCIEICLTCNAAKMNPAPGNDSDYLPVFDMSAMVKILDELKLPLTPYKSAEDFKKAKEGEKLFLEQAMNLARMSRAERDTLRKELQDKKDPTAAEVEMLRILEQAQDAALDAD